MITPKQLEKYKNLHKKIYGFEVSDKEALIQFQALLDVVSILIKKPKSPIEGLS